jgi:hypothetical protein
MRQILRFAHLANAQISSLGKTSKEGDLIYSFPLNKLLQNASHFIGKAPVMWEGRYMDLHLLGGDCYRELMRGILRIFMKKVNLLNLKIHFFMIL